MAAIDDPEFSKRREAGELFERFIGEHYSARGWHVWYRDQERQGGGLGIDIVATKAERQVLLQCKCWAQARQITKDIVDLLARDARRYTDRRAAEHQSLLKFFRPRTYVVVLATTTTLDTDAITQAARHGIVVRERVQFPPRQQVEFAQGPHHQNAATQPSLASAPAEPDGIPFTIVTAPPYKPTRTAWWRRWLRL